MPRNLVVVSFVWFTNNVIMKKTSALPIHARPGTLVEHRSENQIMKIPFLSVPKIPPLANFVFIFHQTQSHLISITFLEIGPLTKSSMNRF